MGISSFQNCRVSDYLPTNGWDPLPGAENINVLNEILVRKQIFPFLLVYVGNSCCFIVFLLLEAWKWVTFLWTRLQTEKQLDVLQFIGSQGVGHYWATEMNWTENVQLNVKWVLTTPVYHLLPCLPFSVSWCVTYAGKIELWINQKFMLFGPMSSLNVSKWCSASKFHLFPVVSCNLSLLLTPPGQCDALYIPFYSSSEHGKYLWGFGPALYSMTTPHAVVFVFCCCFFPPRFICLFA